MTYKYYTCYNGELAAVSEREYHDWMTGDKFSFSFDDCYVTHNLHNYLLQMSYLGIFLDWEKPMPFVLSLSEIHISSASVIEDIIATSYYATYKDAVSGRTTLVNKIKNNLLFALNQDK